MRRNSKYFSLICVLLISCSAAIASAKEKSTAKSSSAVQLKTLSVGYKVQDVNTLTNAKNSWTVVDANQGLLKLRSESGCTVTRPNTWFAPALEWNCEGDKGTSTIDYQIGQLWPLKIGNKEYFHRVGKQDDGTKVEQNWRCSVDSREQVKLSNAPTDYDSYKVVCVTESSIHTWYWAPGAVSPLKYIRKSVATGKVEESSERANASAER